MTYWAVIIYNCGDSSNILPIYYTAMKKISCKLMTNDIELQDALEVRREVFVEEQGISEDEEYDGYDKDALHIVAKEEERVVGTARVRFLTNSQAKIERMAILKPFRQEGIGGRMIAFLDEELRGRHINEVILHAQCAVVAFYKSCGFKKLGSPFWEAGIKHIKMQKYL